MGLKQLIYCKWLLGNVRSKAISMNDRQFIEVYQLVKNKIVL